MISHGREDGRNNKNNIMDRDLLMGGKVLVLIWQWASRELLVTVCSPGWIHARNRLLWTEARHSESNKCLFFIVFLTAEIWPFFFPVKLIFVVQFVSVQKHRSTLTPRVIGLDFVPLLTKRKNTQNVFFSSFTVMERLDFRSECEGCPSSSGYHTDALLRRSANTTLNHPH